MDCEMLSYIILNLLYEADTEDGNMDLQNTTNIPDFILLGFPLHHEIKKLLFTIVLASYCITLVTNMLIIIVVKVNPKLHIPMYIFLCNFSVMEIGYTTVIIPKMLSVLLIERVTISMHGCLTQFYFVFFSGSIENVLLAIMGYDRYLAICNPLRYSSIMTHQVCCWLAVVSWISGCLIPIMPTVWVSKLLFCAEREIDHFFCDFGPLVKLSCSDTSKAVTTFFGQAWILILSCCMVTAISYTLIVSTILKIPTVNGRQKAFSTCASHFTVVSIFYGTIIFTYVRPSNINTSYLDKTVSVFYSVVTPLLNPIIYSLRNVSIKQGLQNMVQRHINIH
ncbi:olfactory receptor 6F1-like [Spea bombifrons]|uniref:olfactory receptor 6F1-like n=1 Tax=Spea bombifrons TaxID=233779 RepID=UPI00234B4546|nr:olfactory receptor 6F1-like [Spea bombifrons]